MTNLPNINTPGPRHSLTGQMRRLRHNQGIRTLAREFTITPDDFIYPIFVTHGSNIRNEIASMPGQFQISVDRLDETINEVSSLGIPAVLVFGLPAKKDATGSDSLGANGITQQAIRKIKAIDPDLTVIADTCLCEYTDHGHCGVIETRQDAAVPYGHVLNNETLALLTKIAVSQAQAGADIVAPSAMMDNMVHAIRQGLDEANLDHVPIMSYSVKYASAFYGPFRDAADGAPQFGDRKTHQMDPSNLSQAYAEAKADIAEGADFIMVKPAISYLDVISRLSAEHLGTPLVAYNVSGEYAMVKAAGKLGWIDEEKVIMEQLLAIKRAGATSIISYHALEVCRWLTSATNADIG